MKITFGHWSLLQCTPLQVALLEGNWEKQKDGDRKK